MTHNFSVISELDFERIHQVIQTVAKNRVTSEHIEQKIDDMEIVASAAIPTDLITMNTEVSCSIEESTTGGHFPKHLKLVYPKNADFEEGQISILTPLGAALLGAKAGNSVTWQGPGGAPRSVFLSKVVYQPEANGDWHL